MAWKYGPLKDTWGWGGVVPVGMNPTGFYFADFRGDHCQIVPDGRVLGATEVALYDNSLELPPNIKGRAQE